MRESILRDLAARVRRCLETGDAAAVLGLDVQLKVQALIGPNTGFDAEVAHTIAMLHWARYRTRPSSAASEDLAVAMRLFDTLHARGLQSAAHPVPEPVRLILDCRRGH
jgi:hypothetical protein